MRIRLVMGIGSIVFKFNMEHRLFIFSIITPIGCGVRPENTTDLGDIAIPLELVYARDMLEYMRKTEYGEEHNALTLDINSGDINLTIEFLNEQSKNICMEALTEYIVRLDVETDTTLMNMEADVVLH